MRDGDGDLSEADSLASTAASEEKEAYEVETILYEKNGHYLVKWAGYPNHRATWEGPDSFDNLDETMRDWQRIKRQIRLGLQAPFNIDAWEREQKRLAKNKERRRRRRQSRREKREEQRRMRRQAIHHPPDPSLAIQLFPDEEPSHPQSDENAHEVHAPRESSPWQTYQTGGNQTGIDMALSDEDADPLFQGPLSRRPSSVLSNSSNGSLFVSEIVTPPLNGSCTSPRSLIQQDTSLLGLYDSEQSAILDDEAGNHARQLHQELEQRLSQGSPPQMGPSQSEERLEDEKPKDPPPPNEPQPSRQQPTREEQTRQRQGSGLLEKSLEKSHQQQTRRTNPRSNQVSATSPSSLLPTPKPAPALSTFATGPKPKQTGRRRNSRAGRTPDIENLKLLKPSDYPARGVGTNLATPRIIQSTDKSRPSNNLDTQARESMTTTSSSVTAVAENATPISTGALQAGVPSSQAINDRNEGMPPTSPRRTRPVETSSRTRDVERSDKPSRLNLFEVAPPRRPAHDIWRPAREDDPWRTGVGKSFSYGRGDSYRPDRFNTRESRRQTVSSDDHLYRGQYDRSRRTSPDRRRYRSRSRSRSPRPNANRSFVTPYVDSGRPSAPARRARNFSERSSSPIQTASPLQTQTRLIHTRAEMTAEDHIAEMPIGVFQPGPGARRVGNYFWNSGEALVHVYFGPEKYFVGVARLCGMTNELKSEFLASKLSGQSGETEMWFREYCSKVEYDQLCDQTIDNTVSGNAWLEGFTVSNTPLFHLTEYLRAQNIVAIYRSSKKYGKVWLLYSRWATDLTSSLNADSNKIPSGVPAFLAARPPLPLLSDLDIPRPKPELSRVRRDFPENVQYGRDRPTRRASLGALQAPRDGDEAHRSAETEVNESSVTRSSDSNLPGNCQPSESNPAKKSVSSPADPRLRGRGSISRSAPHSPVQRELAKNLRSTNEGRASSLNAEERQLEGSGEGLGETSLMDTSLDPAAVPEPTVMLSPATEAAMRTKVLDIFRNTYNITLEKLSTVSGGSGTGLFVPTYDFYLHPCPENGEAQKDCELLQTWLQTFPKVVIHDNWGKFLKRSHGVFMFHESFTSYEALHPDIKRPLWSNQFNFWSYRLSRPLQMADEYFSGESAHFEWIFPAGKWKSVLITEDVFSDLQGTLALIRWYYECLIYAPRLSNLKLMLPPGIMQYLDTRLEKPGLSEEDTTLLCFIKTWIERANSIDPDWRVFEPESLNPLKRLDPSKKHLGNNNIVSFAPEAIPNWGSRQEDDYPGIPKGLTQDERNMDHLVEWFAGWTLFNKANTRKTTVITHTKNRALIRRWNEWGHVTVFSPRTYMSTFNIDGEKFLSRALQEGKTVKDGRLVPVTPRTPFLDPQTPHPPWEDRIRDDGSSPRGEGRHRALTPYPAPYE